MMNGLSQTIKKKRGFQSARACVVSKILSSGSDVVDRDASYKLTYQVQYISIASRLQSDLFTE